MKRKWPNMSPLFRKFMISYIIVLMIPLIAGYMSYRTSIDVAQSISIENSLMTLGQSKQILERNLAEVEGFTKQLAINQDLRRLITEQRNGERYNVYGLWESAGDVGSYSQTNDFLSNFYIYLRNFNVIITPKSVYFRPEHFYELNHYEGMTFKQWEETILHNNHLNEIIPERRYIHKNQESNVLTFLQSLPLNSFDQPMATIGVIIDSKKMGSFLDSISKQYGGWAFIRDNKGNTLISQGIDEAHIAELSNVPSGEYGDTSRMQSGTLLISIRSDRNGWVYTAGIPKKALMEKADRIKEVTGIFAASASLLGLLIGLALAYRDSTPVHRLLSVLREQFGMETGKGRNEYDFFTGSISSLVVSNKQLQTELIDQLPMLRDAFIKRLLVGEIHSAREIEATSSHTGIAWKGECGYVGILNINGYSDLDNEEIIHELSVARLVMRQALLRMEPELLVTDWGTDKIAFLHMQDRKPRIEQGTEIETGLIRLIENANVQSHLPVFVGIGAPFQALPEISRSFDEAQQALDNAVYTGKIGMIRYEDTIRETSMYYYPIDSEQRLLNTLKAGEMEEGKRILSELFDRNFVDRGLSYEMTQQFMTVLKGTFLKMIDQKAFHEAPLAESVRKQIVQMQPTDGVPQLQEKFQAMVEAICAMIAKKKSDLDHEIVRAVTRFLETEYKDPDLTLHRIADTIGQPEKYMSQLFKEHTGENLFDYLERIRIAKASNLLLENRLTIDEITVHVGYNSAHSFRRAFKRVKGVSPRVFRNTENIS
ncbi:helix-turn-helix domain-containing protein [Paenibacillus sp. LHD-117]|uniref:helix-turn-helix domain-containing protein n=1 Tax=Paenibacillus sp. LHD-117 TaxID=3071412 RepID=UPI0027E078C1|nr:helix-turn-helix domain-containing protein [Paenibacillus sp. LHD-117]MDQ6418128.1 helix-turn-helix domain-containing protein [Paenibacillus sp. LHD-117]